MHVRLHRRSICFAVLMGLSAVSWAITPSSVPVRPAATPVVEKIGLDGFATAISEACNIKAAGGVDQEDAALNRALEALSQLDRHTANTAMVQDFAALLEGHRFSRLHQLGSSALEHFYQGPFRVTKGGLYEHLHEAIQSHEQRVPEYARLTDGRSSALFRRLASLQKLNLPVAWYVDQRARRFQTQGIPIITGELVSMSGIPPLNRPPLHRGVLSASSCDALEFHMKSYRKQCMKDLSQARFQDIAARTYKFVQTVKQVETKENCHLAMTLHLIESVGLAALHATRYQQQSKGETVNLSRLFIAIQLFPLQECLVADRKAQECHAMGVGVIVNDVPQIPFEKEWETANQADKTTNLR